MYGQSFEGYSCKALDVLLYDYSVMGYDVELSYKWIEYYLMEAGETAASRKEKQVFDSPMALLENFIIDGKTLLELAPQIEYIEPV